MSLFSKLLSGKKPTLSDVVDLFKGKQETPAETPVSSTRPDPWQAPAASSPAEQTPLGRSWGETMPNEPNQYNYPGTYHDYFEEIFRAEFAAYPFERKLNERSSRTTSYTFHSGERTVLVVELVSRRSDVQKLRRDCANAGIPYLRFYYDYHGWWNTRSYVVERIGKAIAR